MTPGHLEGTVRDGPYPGLGPSVGCRIYHHSFGTGRDLSIPGHVRDISVGPSGGRPVGVHNLDLDLDPGLDRDPNLGPRRGLDPDPDSERGLVRGFGQVLWVLGALEALGNPVPLSDRRRREVVVAAKRPISLGSSSPDPDVCSYVGCEKTARGLVDLFSPVVEKCNEKKTVDEVV